eukprot:scaffold127297_cov69-Attheya_sp.AAC.1
MNGWFGPTQIGNLLNWTTHGGRCMMHWLPLRGKTVMIDCCDADASFFGRQWEQMYEKLLAFKEKYGHCNVPATYEKDQSLAKWVINHQRFERIGQLDEVRFERLDVIGFVWEPGDSRWNELYERLEAFKEKHGHCQISGDSEEDPALANWVRNQRTYWRSDKLKNNRFERLDALGFVWNSTQSRWNVMLNHCEDFTRVHGRVSVPHNYVTSDGTELGLWAENLKSTKQNLTPKTIAELDALGFVWDSQLDHGLNISCLKDSTNCCVLTNYSVGDKTNGLKRNEKLSWDALADFNKRQKLEY